VLEHTPYAWKTKHGGMNVSQAREEKQPHDEDTNRRKLVGGSEFGQRSPAELSEGPGTQTPSLAARVPDPGSNRKWKE
jgi:hypothetical protein